jgi:hypothetical protein
VATQILLIRFPCQFSGFGKIDRIINGRNDERRMKMLKHFLKSDLQPWAGEQGLFADRAEHKSVQN